MRKNFYPDFGFSGNDLAYHFILPKEIWIDGQVLSEETEYSIAIELIESDLMAKGSVMAMLTMSQLQITDKERRDGKIDTETSFCCNS